MVTAALGTGHYTFHRLLAWLDAWFARNPESAGFVQHGCSAPPRHAEGRPTVPHAKLLHQMGGSVAVVTHGGTGSIMDARSLGLKPIVVPRSFAWGEAVDDHQVAFCEKLAADGWIHLATTEAETHRHLDRALVHGDEYRLRVREAQAVPPAAEQLPRICADLVAAPARRLYPDRFWQVFRLLRGRQAGTNEKGERR
jgi:hypothetical protein